MKVQRRLLAISVIGLTIFSHTGCSSNGDEPIEAQTVSSTAREYTEKSKTALREAVEYTKVKSRKMLDDTDQVFNQSYRTLGKTYDKSKEFSKSVLDTIKRLSDDVAAKTADAAKTASDKAKRLIDKLKY